MANLSRRQFLTRTSLTVAAGAAAAAAGPQAAGLLGSAEAAGAKAPAPARAARTAEQPVVAYVRGGANGEVTVMAGHRKIVRTDPDLVRRLLDALD